MNNTITYLLKSIPDPGDNSLAAALGGNVVEKSHTAAEQFLRILSNLEADKFTAVIRFYFNPQKHGQERTGIELELTSSADNETDIIKKVVEAGPLSSIYDLEKSEESLNPGYSNFTSLTETVKLEKVFSPFIRRYLPKVDPQYLSEDDIAHIPEIYYFVKNFQAVEDNDWMNIDHLLDKYKSEIMIEILVSPTNAAEEFDTFNNYIKGNNVREQIQQKKLGFEQTFRDPLGDEIAGLYDEINQNLQKPLLNFSIKCWGKSNYDTKLLASTVAENCFAEGAYSLISVSDSQEEWKAQIEAAQNSGFNFEFNDPRVWNILNEIAKQKPAYKKFKRLSRLASVEELLGVFRLPVGKSHSSSKTIMRHTDPKPVSEDKETILIGDDLELGKSKARDYSKLNSLEDVFSKFNPEYHEMRMNKQLLKKHMFIAGVPGSGKTTAMNNLLTQFAHFKKPVKFLVIEPAKTEYRLFKKFKSHPDPVIKDLAENLQVYTIGNEEISPFRFNPLAYPEGVTLDEHIGTLLSCFQASMPMGGPLQGLLAEAVEDVYENIPDGKKFPRLNDLVNSARKIIETKGYDSEIKGNLKAALDVRLGLLVRRSLGKVFDCDEGVPSLEAMFKDNIILEMDYLTQEHVSLMSLFVLSSLREYIKVNRKSGMDLQHVILLEEAHNIVGRSGEASGGEEGPDPKAFAASYVARMLAELRALGEGIIIADQLPTAVAPEVVKNTGAKLAHRLVSTDDREDLGAAMLLNETQTQDLARLQVGEAYFYSEGLFRPRRVRALNSTAYLALGQKELDDKGRPKFPESPNKSELIEIIKNEKWFVDSNIIRIQMELDNIQNIKNRAEVFYNNGLELNDEYKKYYIKYSEMPELNNFAKRKISNIFNTIILKSDEAKRGIKELEIIQKKQLNKKAIFFFPKDLKARAKNLLKEVIFLKNNYNSVLLNSLEDLKNNYDKLL